TNLKRIYISIIVLLCSNLVNAQPGWQDFTPRYSYSILDKNGKEISFKNNKNYSIMVDSMLYKSTNIAQDSLKPAIQDSYVFENQIRINDFSLVIPQKKYQVGQKQLEIKIIHKKDTMYVCQTSRTGSFYGLYFQGKPSKPSPDLTFQFIAGRYFFPTWTKNLM